jgi:maltose alpha-D-glucosyltransferase/alpha-amylase
LAQLEAALPAWLPRQRWFGAKSRRIQSTRVLDWVDISLSETNEALPADRPSATRTFPPAIFFIEVTYFDGSPDVYQLPITISTGPDADEVSTSHADSIVTTFASSSGFAVLHEATTREDFRHSLLALIELNKTLSLSPIRTDGIPNGGAIAETEPASLSAEQRSAGANDRRSIDVLPVAPTPLSAQPGEAATGPKSDEATRVAGSQQKMQPSASPSPGDVAHTDGSLYAHASSAFYELHPSQPLSSRVSSAEQSNTSIIYGDKLILKFFRRLQPGENPDLEIGRFLTEVAHFSRVAPFLGEISVIPTVGEKTTVAMLQGLVPSKGDGWQWFLEQLASYFPLVSETPIPLAPPSPSFLNERAPWPESLEPARRSLEAAALLGRRTAELHLALSSSTDDPAFKPEPSTIEDLDRDAKRIQAQISSSLEALKLRLPTLDDQTSDAAGLLLSKRLELIARSHSITATAATGQRIRIHGDFHLGQTLRTESGENNGDFVLLDFEGEPARSLDERRCKQSPLKDVAGMIRSFSYVAHASLKQFLDGKADGERKIDTSRLEAWARAWQSIASAEFLWAYREGIAANGEILPSPKQSQVLLDAYLLEKALYEMLYELNNRPSWLHIPIAGILSL